jgi:hypothetical protein
VGNDNGLSGNGAIYNLAGALFDIQNDQAIYCACGGFESFHNAGTVRKSSSMGTTDFYIPFNNTGTVDVQSGTLSFDAGVSLAGGMLNFGISSRTSYGRINIARDVALTGTASVNLRNGFLPDTGNSFTNLTFDSRTGFFTSASLPSAVAWRTNYSSTNFSLTVLNVKPVLAPIADQALMPGGALTLTNNVTAPVFESPLTDFEANAAGSAVLFQAPRFSGTTSGLLSNSPNVCHRWRGRFLPAIPAHARCA